MGYDESVYTKILNEYDALRAEKQAERHKRIESVYQKVPEIEQIDKEIYRLGIENIKNIYHNIEKKDEYNRKLKQDIGRLQEERLRLIHLHGLDERFDKITYSCALCEDTGYVDGKKCVCFQQKLINAGYLQSNIHKLLDRQNFNTFSLDVYAKTVPPREKLSPYENMTDIYETCLQFCERFDTFKRSLLFYGDTGLGKTFLSSCIAKELIERGKTVIYTRASHLFSMYEDYKFGRAADGSVKQQLDRVFDVDLLILDDLGTECMNKNIIPFFYDILESRILQQKKMVISTNFTMQEISKTYSTRFTSRIYESFLPLRFFGEDIRICQLK